jgi:hypothetical protein
MEKIKPVIDWIVRNRFWLSCGAMAMASIVTWFIAWRGLELQREESAKKIKSKKEAIDAVLKVSADTGQEANPVNAHPNAVTEAEMNKRIEAARAAAMEAWKVRYEQQKDMLVFAKELPDQVRTPLEKHKPMEKPITEELLDITKRSTFLEFFRERMPELVRSTINATWLYDAKGERLKSESEKDPRGKDPSAALKESPKQEDLVIWRPENQALWHSKVTKFTGYDGNTEKGDRPTSTQMLALQQDVWILEALLKIIAEVNKGYIANDLAPVKRIDHILVGKDAKTSEPKVSDVSYVVPGGVGAAGVRKSGGRVSDDRKDSEAAADSAKKTLFNPGEGDSPFHGRYVDRTNQQLNRSELDRLYESPALSDRTYLYVAKRVPVRVAVKMDERMIGEFLAVAANSPFTFEVRSIRINTPMKSFDRAKPVGSGGGGAGQDKVDKAGGGGGIIGAGEGGDDSGGGGGGGDDGAASLLADEKNPETRKSYDVRVEFIGIVKIYNEPNPAALMPAGAGGEGGADGGDGDVADDGG